MKESFHWKTDSRAAQATWYKRLGLRQRLPSNASPKKTTKTKPIERTGSQVRFATFTWQKFRPTDLTLFSQTKINELFVDDAKWIGRRWQLPKKFPLAQNQTLNNFRRTSRLRTLLQKCFWLSRPAFVMTAEHFFILPPPSFLKKEKKGLKLNEVALVGRARSAGRVKKGCSKTSANGCVPTQKCVFCCGSCEILR